jgi:hypothetical protein
LAINSSANPSSPKEKNKKRKQNDLNTLVDCKKKEQNRKEKKKTSTKRFQGGLL